MLPKTDLNCARFPTLSRYRRRKLLSAADVPTMIVVQSFLEGIFDREKTTRDTRDKKQRPFLPDEIVLVARVSITCLVRLPWVFTMQDETEEEGVLELFDGQEFI